MNSSLQEQGASPVKLRLAVPDAPTGRDFGRAAALNTHRIARCA